MATPALPTQATIGHGALLKRGDGATPTEQFTPIAEVLSISGPSSETEMVAIRHLQSPGKVTEYIPGFIEPGEVSFEIDFLPNHPSQDARTGLQADKDARRKRNYQVVFPSTPEVTAAFSAYVKTFEPDVPADEPMTASVTLQVTGLVSWTYAA